MEWYEHKLRAKEFMSSNYSRIGNYEREWVLDSKKDFSIFDDNIVGWTGFKTNSYLGKLEGNSKPYVSAEGRDAKLRVLFTLKALKEARDLIKV